MELRSVKNSMSQNAIFVNHDIYPCAKNLGVLSYIKYCANEFEDTAYFEPYYLKDFILETKIKLKTIFKFIFK